jgi:hypothetical protein
MISQICCPHCGHPVEENACKCGNCGVDLAIAAVLAEREILPIRLTSALPVTPEILVPRLVSTCWRRANWLRQMERALELQKIRKEAGRPLLGRLCVN